MKTTKELLGARIKELRKARQLSQEKLAEIIDVEPRHLSRIEVGKSYPTLDRLERIAAALECDMRDFFDFEHLKDKEEKISDIQSMLIELNEEKQKLTYRFVKMLREP